MTTLLLMAMFIITAVRFYRRRTRFQQLTKKEWQQYIVGFVVAWGTAVAIIFGGAKLLQLFQVETFRLGFGILFILIALSVAQVIFHKLVPQRVKDIYET